MKHLHVGGKAKGKSIKPTGVLWHEAIKGRSAEDVASTSFYAKIEISIILYFGQTIALVKIRIGFFMLP